MQNARKIANPKLQAALNDVNRIMERHGFAGAFMLISEDEAAFAYRMHAPWSAMRPDPAQPMGFRLRANAAEMGRAQAEKRITGALHTICQLADFGFQTQEWMMQLQAALRARGINFEHKSFGGEPLRNITFSPAPESIHRRPPDKNRSGVI